MNTVKTIGFRSYQEKTLLYIGFLDGASIEVALSREDLTRLAKSLQLIYGKDKLQLKGE